MKKSKFEKIAKTWLVIIVCVFVLGELTIQAVESSNNVEQQKIEGEINTLESDINGLNIEKQNKTNFSYVNDVVSAQGYTYSQTDAVAYNTSNNNEEN